ncbi:MAG: aldehyde dehydrogenase family protein, partial [Chitinophagaceae bacterium]
MTHSINSTTVILIQTVNPYNNQVIKTFDELSDAELETKLSTAQNAFEVWKFSKVEQRSKLLLDVASRMRQRKAELAALITLEMGKLIAQSEAEVDMCASVYEYYGKNGPEFLEDRPIEIPDGKAFVRLSPIGIVLAVEPWNYPFNQVARLAAPNIMAGNVIALKHASNVPQCGAMIEELFREAGAREGIFTNLYLSGKRIAKLAEDKRIAGMSLTGSEAAGSSLAEAAGKNL